MFVSTVDFWGTMGHFYKDGLTLIPSWISDHTPGKILDDITFPRRNYNEDFWLNNLFYHTLYDGCNN